MTAARFRLAVTAIIGAGMLAPVACGGGQRMTVESTWSPEPVADQGPASDEAESLDEKTEPEPLEQQAAPPPPLIGVRPDLALAPGPGARCPCLAVEVGSPGEAKFQWQAGAPNAGPGALAIAVSARGVECPGGEPDETKRRPSISAVDIEGNDVVVEIEELPEGAPLAAGALIPQPGPGGSIYVRARGRDVVYARSASSSRCKVR